MSEANYPSDPALGHDFYAITGMTDKCRLCGCTVGDCQNTAGKAGGRFHEPCKAPRPTTGDGAL